MHLAVAAGKAAVGVQHHRGVVVKPRRPSLEQRGHDHHAQFPRQCAQLFGAGAGDGFGQIAQGGVLDLAEIGRVVQFLQQHQARAARCRSTDVIHLGGEVGDGILPAALLHQGNIQWAAHGRGPTRWVDRKF